MTYHNRNYKPVHAVEPSSSRKLFFYIFDILKKTRVKVKVDNDIQIPEGSEKLSEIGREYI